MAEKYPHLLIFKEKHCDIYYHITSKEDRIKVLVDTFKRRDEDGYWYHYDEPKPPQELVEVPEDLDDEAKKALEKINKDREKFNRQQKEIAQERLNYMFAKAGDEDAIINIMYDRQDYQYEEFTTEYYAVIN